MAGLYSVLLLVTFGFGFNGVQSYSVATSLNDAFGVPVVAIAAGIAVLVGVIIAGGVRRIARIADVLVPVMALGYIAMALVVLALNLDALPAALMLIVKSAFGLEPAIGGGIGAAIVMGVRRGLFSNEAGLGSAPNVAAVAEVPHPASQGVVQAFSVFIDTLIVCSCTAFIILLGDVYRPGAEEIGGVALAQASLASHIGEGGRIFVSIAMMLFGFTTMIYNYYLGENSLVWIGGNNKPLIFLYRVAVIALCGWGATSDLGTIFAFADVTMGLLALVNLFALVMLFKPALKLMRDYDSQIEAGASEPVFNPEKFGYHGIDSKAWKGGAWDYRPDEAVASNARI